MGEALIREPAVAGQFYPADAGELSADIDRYLADAEPDAETGDVRGLIVPHAGYLFSGPTAGYAYRTVAGRTFDRVIVIAPSHRDYFTGVSAYGGAGYRTPLGVAGTDAAAAGRLAAAEGPVSVGETGHRAEHSLEVQIPFLQKVLPGVPVVPLVMGEQAGDVCRALADVLTEVFDGEDILIVASTDLSHFHPYETARSLDAAVNERINAFDPEGLLADLAAGRCEACGGGPAAVCLMACRNAGASGARVLKHINSGDVIEDKDQVVGYTAAVIYR